MDEKHDDRDADDKRDFFAAFALLALLASGKTYDVKAYGADEAYSWAQAMMQWRKEWQR